MTINSITLNKLIFIVEILFAEILYTVHLKKRKLYPVRLLVMIAVSVLVAVFFPVFSNDVFYSSVMFALIFALTLPLLNFTYKEPWANILFCGIAAYTSQHCAYMFTNFVVTLIQRDVSPLLGFYADTTVDLSKPQGETAFALLVYLLCTYAVYALFYFFFARQIKKNEGLQIKSRVVMGLVGAGLFIDIILNSVFLYVDKEPTIVSSLIIYSYGVFSCALLLSVQFKIVLAEKFEAERNLTRMLWQKEKEQYRYSKETIDTINLKCHDIKHQIRGIGIRKSLPQEVVGEIESAISIYDASVQTGNEVLDIILTEKSLRCYKENIIFSCVANGAAIAFMSEGDICSLFGNALDNAIEAVMHIEPPEKRVIGLTMRVVGNMISINVNNTYEGDIVFENGLPRTVKDRHFHGFGIRSMKSVAEKYGGDLAISVKNSVFNLDVIIPIQNA